LGEILNGGSQDKYVHAGKLEEVVRLEAQAKAFERLLEKEFEIAGLKPGMKVLDAGCGTGAVARRMAAKVSPGEIYGIDIDSLFISEARKLAANEGINNVRFELGDVDDLKHDDSTFDVSYCRLVLMHVKDPVKTVSELRRVTKKGGVVAVSDNDDGGVIVYPEMPKMMDMWAKYGRSAKTRGEDRYIGR
jgi:ubiquinone/menaquinone biosynthesis C-methylase UbiE